MLSHFILKTLLSEALDNIILLFSKLGSALSPSRQLHMSSENHGQGGQDSDGSTSGSTTLSAPSSPGGAGNGLGSRLGDANLSGTFLKK